MIRRFTDTRGDICAADLPRLLTMAGLTRLPMGMDEGDLRDELIAGEVAAQREALPTYHPLHQQRTLSPYNQPAEAGDRGMAEPPHVGNCEPGLAQPGGGSVPPANPASEWSCTGLYRGDDHLIDVVACPQCFGTDDDCGRCAGAGKVVIL